jgi:hypothetical protein
MQKRGFEKVNGVYVNSDYIIEDLHADNVMIDGEGNFHFIDTVSSLNTPEDEFGGSREYGSGEVVETEDVAREDRIFLYDALGNSSESNNFAENNNVNIDNNGRNKNLSSLEGLEIIETLRHDFKNIAEARSWAKENITGTYRNTNTNEDISISGKAIYKYLSEKAVSKSVNLNAHLSALKQLPGQTHLNLSGFSVNNHYSTRHRAFSLLHFSFWIVPV